jgi:hypothetical protein
MALEDAGGLRGFVWYLEVVCIVEAAPTANPKQQPASC